MFLDFLLFAFQSPIMKRTSLLGVSYKRSRSSLVAQRLKHLPPMRETLVRSPGQEDLLEKEMVTHSSIIAWKIPWMEKPGRLHGVAKSQT